MSEVVVSTPTLDDVRAECAELMVRVSNINAQLTRLASAPVKSSEERNLTVVEAASRLRKSKNWLHKNWRKLPLGGFKVGKTLLFKEHALARYERMRQAA